MLQTFTSAFQARHRTRALESAHYLFRFELEIRLAQNMKFPATGSEKYTLQSIRLAASSNPSPPDIPSMCSRLSPTCRFTDGPSPVGRSVWYAVSGTVDIPKTWRPDVKRLTRVRHFGQRHLPWETALNCRLLICTWRTQASSVQWNEQLVQTEPQNMAKLRGPFKSPYHLIWRKLPCIALLSLRVGKQVLASEEQGKWFYSDYRTFALNLRGIWIDGGDLVFWSV